MTFIALLPNKTKGYATSPQPGRNWPQPSQSLSPPPAADHLPVSVDARLAPQPRPERLVEVSKLSPEDLAAAQNSAARLDFRNTNSLLAHCDGVLSAIAQASRQLLTGVRLDEAGEVGRIAAAVIDGVKILRIQDLQAEAAAGQPHVIEFFAIGTAVLPLEQEIAPEKIADPIMVLSVND